MAGHETITTKIVISGQEFNLVSSVKQDSRAMVLVVHGMMEHSGRYGHLRDYLLENGFGFASLDLPGHGDSIKDPSIPGLWPEGGFDICASALKEGGRELKRIHGRPIILFGHSLGSFIAIDAISRFGNEFIGCILSGTNDAQNPVLIHSGRIMAGLASFIFGKKYKSVFIHNLAFGKFNDRFKPARTKFDWLTRDGKAVNKYISDPRCGFVCSAHMFCEFSGFLMKLYKPEKLSKIPGQMKILLISGKMDPVGDFGNGPRKFSQRLLKLSVKNVRLNLYEDARHELINELNKEEVMADILGFCQSTV
ncbi:MAG: alpha/beta hydrolase [Clostridia bacterium]|nr:alpha/beta hydrolase [Clostridia bacterium]